MGEEGALNWEGKLLANHKFGVIIKRQGEMPIFVSAFYRAVHTIFQHVRECNTICKTGNVIPLVNIRVIFKLKISENRI